MQRYGCLLLPALVVYAAGFGGGRDSQNCILMMGNPTGNRHLLLSFGLVREEKNPDADMVLVEW